MKKYLFAIIIIITIYVFINFWFIDKTPKKTHCNPAKEYCSTLNQYDNF